MAGLRSYLGMSSDIHNNADPLSCDRRYVELNMHSPNIEGDVARLANPIGVIGMF
jgi:hypothetical protein